MLPELRSVYLKLNLNGVCNTNQVREAFAAPLQWQRSGRYFLDISPRFWSALSIGKCSSMNFVLASCVCKWSRGHAGKARTCLSEREKTSEE